MDYEKFEKELAKLLNYHSAEDESNTPDFVLASYLTSCLKSFDGVMNARTNWYAKAVMPKEATE